MNMKISDLKHGEMFIILTIIYLAIRLPILTVVPLMQDEAFYSVMIEEQIENPTTSVTLFGEPVGWKPPLFFWISGFFVQFLRNLPIPIEAVYRLPVILFGLINVFLVFFICEKITGKKEEAFLMTIVYATMGITVHTDLRVLTDTMCGTFIFAGVLAYLNSSEDRKMFLLGGIFTVLAYLTKQTNAAVVPIVAFAYLYQKDKKKIFDYIFILSLLALPFGMILEGLAIKGSITGKTVYLAKAAILDKFNVEHIVGSLIPIFPLAGILITLAVFGFWKNWRSNLMMSTWAILTVFPVIAGTMMPFYFYPIVPAVAYFAVVGMAKENGKTKIDKFFYIFFTLVVLTSLIISISYHLGYAKGYRHQKTAGEFLAGKENVLIVGEYEPGIPAYKMLTEKRESGRWLDYGLVLMSDGRAREYYESFLTDYYVNESDVVDGNFRTLFANNMTYRKSTEITKFEYICIVGSKIDDLEVEGELVLEDLNLRIIKITAR